MIRTLTAVALAASTALVTTSALAQDGTGAPTAAPAAVSTTANPAPSDAYDSTGVSAAVLLGYGFNDAFKLGFGARVGYTLPMRVYIGATFVYHLGTSTDIGGGKSVTTNVFYPGVEGGYDFLLGPVVLRPYVGLGMAIVKVSDITVGPITVPGGSSNNFAIWPGATLMYPVTTNFFVGVDARFLIVSGANAFSTFLTAGYKF